MKVNKQSFIDESDVGNVTPEMARGRGWFTKKGTGTANNDIDRIAQDLSSELDSEITKQDVIDFIIANPTRSVKKTTDRMIELQKDYKDLTGRSIKQHGKLRSKLGLEEPIAEQAEVEGFEKEETVPFRTEGINVSEQASVDLQKRQNAIKELNKLQEQYGVPINVINSNELSAEAQAKARQVGAPKAYYQNGEVFILSDQIESVSDVKKSYFHEALVHKGLDLLFEAGPVTLLGKTYPKNKTIKKGEVHNGKTLDKDLKLTPGKDALLDDVFNKASDETIADRAGIYAKGTPIDELTDTQKREIAEEVLATLNETESPRLQVMMDKLYNFIKKLFGFTSKQFSKDDLRNMLREHNELVIKQKKGSEVADKRTDDKTKFRTSEGTLISTDEMIQSENFKRWSDNAQYVPSDEAMGYDFKTGSPVVVEAYHGGYAPINTFDADYGGETTADNQFGAFYFSNNKEVASDYSKESIVRRMESQDVEYFKDDYNLSDEDIKNISEDGETVDFDMVTEWASDEDNQNVVEGFVHFENPLVVDAAHEGLRELEQRFNVQEALGFISGKGEGIPEFIYESDEIKWDEDEVENYKDEIEERAREEYGLEEDEEVEDYMISEATDYVMEENGFEKEFPEYDGLIITNVIDDIGEGSKDFQNLYIGVKPEQIKSQDNRGAFDRYSDNIRFRATPSKANENLIVLHNLNGDNILNIDKVGGLPVPSLAITRTDVPFTSYGDISLIADKSMVDPQGYGQARTFNADIYSPRYPSVNYDINWKKFDEAFDEANKIAESYDFNPISIGSLDLENDGFRKLDRNDVTMLAYLMDQGKAPRPKVKDVAIDKALHKYITPRVIHANDLIFNEDFVADVTKLFTELDEKLGTSLYIKDGKPNENLLSREARKVANAKSTKETDKYANADEVEKRAIGTKSKKAAYETWLKDKFDSMVDKERIFKGFTNAGSRRYIPHTLDNVVKELTKGLQGAEGTFYGVGSVRSGAAKEFQSIEDIQRYREDIISKEEFEPLKEKAAEEFDEILDLIKPYYKWDTEGWSYSSNAGESLLEYAKKGRSADFKAFPKDVKQQINEFLSRLKNMPTEYFESKVQRAVGLDEFKAAVVPNDVSQDVLDVLDKNGITVKKYNPKTEGDRSKKTELAARQQGVKFRVESPSNTKEIVNPEYWKGKTFGYVHSTEPSPYLGSRFGQDVEPSGKYVTMGYAFVPANKQEGTVSFNNPLVIDITDQQYPQWKRDLSNLNNGSVKKRLSNKLRKQGYDAIITVEEYKGKYYTSETVILDDQIDSNKGSRDLEPKFRVAESQKELDDFVKDSKVKETVYHGTDAKFTEFDKATIGSATDTGMAGKGFYFSKDENYAKTYARGDEGKTLSVKLDIKNPYKINSKEDYDLGFKVPDETIEDLARSAEVYSETFTNNLKDKGYDGVVDNVSNQIVAFGPDQILIEPKEDVKFRTDDLPTVYHGSDVAIDEFDLDKVKGSGKASRNKAGIFFTSDPRFAQSWGENMNERKLDLKNPVTVDSKDPIIQEIFGEDGFSGNIKAITKKKADKLKEAGFDGVVGWERWTDWNTNERNKSDVYLAFGTEGIVKPTEVKIEEEREKVNTNPSDKAKEAGNYKMGHIKLDGFDISIENPKGSIREGVSEEGEKWSNVMPADYGYIKKTKSADGDHLDIFLGDDYGSDKIFAIDQINKDGKFDEVKLLANFTDVADAANAYLLAYEEGWMGMGTIMETNKDLLKEWIKDGKTSEGYETGKAWTKIYTGISNLVANEGQMPKPKQQSIQALRGERNNSVRGVEQELQDVHGRHGEKAREYVIGSDKQQRELREGELPMDDKLNSVEKQKKRTSDNIKRENYVSEGMGERAQYATSDIESKDSQLQVEYRESPYYTYWLSTQELEDPNVQRRIDANGTSRKKVWDKYINIQAKNKQRLERERSGRGEEDVRFRATSQDPTVQKLLDRLQAVEKLSKTAARIKGLEDEKLKGLGIEKKFIQDKIDLYKEAVKEGKTETKEMIKEVQKAITDYAKKTLPLTEAGAREIGPILTLIKEAQTPESIEKAFDRIDELAGLTTEKTKRRKAVSKVNRLLKWMTGLKKMGTKRVGKFNYPDTKEFQRLKKVDEDTREWTRVLNSNKATKEAKEEAQAGLEKLWNDINEKENKTALDDAMMKLIELRRLGSKATSKLAEILSNDLEVIYKTAKETKNEADLETALQRKEEKDLVESFLTGGDKALKDKTWFKRALSRLNTTTADIFGNWETLMTMIGGTELRDKMSLMMNETQMAVGKQQTMDNVLDEAKDIYGSKSRTATLNLVHDLSSKEYSLRKPNRKGKEGKGKPTELSKLELMDIYNAVKNPDIENDYYLSYGDITIKEDGSRDMDAQRSSGKERIDTLIENLSEQDKQFADVMQAELDKYYDRLNEIHIILYNRDLPRVENYWPSTAEREQDIDVMEQFFADSRHPSATKERMAHRTPEPRDAFNKFTKHIEEAEWYSNMSLPVNEINKIFKDNNIKSLIEDARGKGFYQNIGEAIQNVGLMPPGKQQQKSMLNTLLNPLLNNWVASKIGATPSVPLKQLLSAVNYSENMPAAEWTTGFIKGMANPKQTWKEMLEIPYLKTRLGDGYSEAVQRALNGDENVHKSRATNFHTAFKNLMTIGTRYGDITAIIFGGKPYLDYLMKQEGMSEKEAVDKFLQDTLRSQQAPFSSTLSKLQNSRNPFFRAIFAFSNTPSQYMRKLFEANQNLRVQKQRLEDGKISQDEYNKVRKQTAKIHTIYGIVNTVTFTMAGSLISAAMRGSDADDEIWKDMLNQLTQTYVGGLPVIKDLIGGATRQALGMPIYDSAKPFIEGLDEVVEAGIKLSKGTAKNPEKEYEKVGQGVATMLGIPYYNLKKDIKAIPPFREQTFRETRIKEAERKLTDLSKSDSTYEADMSLAMKKAYTKAKSKASRLKKKNKFLQADQIESLIGDSKVNLWELEYAPADIEMELKMFTKMVESIE